MKTLAERVAEAPADFNRATRRSVKSLFRWLSPAQQTREPLTPRYIRRHGVRMLATTDKRRTRRERKEAARIKRMMA